MSLDRQFIRYAVACIFAPILMLGVMTRASTGGLQTPGSSNQSRSATAPGEQEGSLIEVGKPIVRDLKGGESHLYRLTLNTGQFVQVTVEQRGVAVQLMLFGFGGKLLVEGDDSSRSQGLKSIMFVSETTGSYSLLVRALEKDAAPGRYELRIAELRPATTQDSNRLAARKLFAEASSLMQKGAESRLEALAKFQEALPLFRAAADRGGEAKTLLGLSVIFNDLGDYQKAIDTLTPALELFREIRPLADEAGNRNAEAVMLTTLGTLFIKTGSWLKALDYYSKALQLFRVLDDRDGESLTLNTIGNIHSALGDRLKALEYYNQALLLGRSMRYTVGEATALNNMGLIYFELGETGKALSYYEQALRIRRAVPDRVGEATTLNNLGAIYSERGEGQKALEYYFEALRLRRELRDRAGEATTLNNIGLIYYKLGDTQRALDHYEQALPIMRAIGDRRGEAVTLNNMGAIYVLSGAPRKVLDSYQQALRLMRDIGDKKGEEGVLSAIGVVYESLGELKTALDHYLMAITISEHRRQTTNDEIPDLNGNQSAEIYTRAALLSFTMGQAEQSFSIAERGRARNLLDQLASGRVPLLGQIDPQLAEREIALRRQINGLDRALREERGKPTASLNQNLISQLETQLSNVNRDYESLLVRIRTISPKYAWLRGAGTPLTVSEVQKLLNADTTLLHYLVTPDRTIVFAISRDSFHAFEAAIKERELFELISEFRSFPTVRTRQPDKLKRLYRHLITPVQDYLRTPLVGIVPHGVLHYLPFSALLNPAGRYLDEEHTIFYLPNASTLRYVNKGETNKGILAVAYSRPERFGPLPNVDKEVRAIGRTPGARTLIGADASEGNVRALAGKQGILHLAAHYELNNQSPLLSRVWLAADKSSDGFLEIHEIYDLNLSRTDLVMLSASQTQLGKLTRGDEIIALNRAFLYAGARTVIGSLWNVDDEATVSLMVSFYKHLTQGVRKAEALRRAQIETRAKYPHPYYWAAFVLTGDP